jgi:hypothetical protein
VLIELEAIGRERRDGGGFVEANGEVAVDDGETVEVAGARVAVDPGSGGQFGRG